MKRHTLACFLLSVLVIASSSAASSGEAGDPRVSGDETDIIGNTTWTKDIRITRNSGQDTEPQIVVDSEDDAHIIWQRMGYWTQIFDRRGEAKVKEIFITPHVVRGYGSPYRYPLGPQIAIDDDAHMHVVWDDGGNNVYYQKFDEHADSLTQEIQVGPKDNVASHCPSVAVDPVKNNVHIVHEDYIYQCEDILYGKRDNDGKVLVNEFSLSAAVSSHCEHSTLTTDGFGNTHVVFGSAIGCWWRKVDSNGLPQGNAVRIKGPPAYMIADVACTPNGEVHLVWTWNESVRYTRMDNNGTVLDENITLSRNSVSPGPPRIAASNGEDSVHVVWHDRVSGNEEIYYAKIEEDRYNQTPDNVRLTDDAAMSTLPWVDVSSDDDVYVVWQDMRDGNWEVYYKFMFNFGMDLGVVNVAELAEMYFFHPDQTKKMDLYIKNLGLLPDDYEVEVTADEWAGEMGWDYALNATRFEDVPGNDTVLFRLTVTSPKHGTPGDFINFSVNATSSSGETESIAWRAFLIVEKAVLIDCDEPTRLISAGDTVRFDLTVANIGDVQDSYGIETALLPDDAGWAVVSEPGTMNLRPGEVENLTVNLSAPAGARANENGTVFVRVRSMTDAAVWDGMKLLARVDPAIHLELEAPVPSLLVDPGGSVEFPIVVRNEGNLLSEVTISLSSSKPRPGWTVQLDSETVGLAGGEEQTLTLTVSAPEDAVAGTGQTVEVSAVSDDLTARASVHVTAVVDEVHGVVPALGSMPPTVHAGEDARFQVDVTNEGNSDQTVTLTSALVPEGWDVSFEVDDLVVQAMTLASRETRTVEVVVSTPYGAAAGRSPEMHLVLTDGEGRSQALSFQVGIYAMYAVDISAPVHEGAGPPGGTVTYQLEVHNMGNGPDTFLLDHGTLPGTGWVASFHAADGTPVDAVALDGGQRVGVELRVQIPLDAGGTDPVDMMVSATSTSAEVDEVKLVLNLLMADIRIGTVKYEPAGDAGTKPRQVTVQVSNDGTSAAGNVTVVMKVDGEEVGREVVDVLEEGSFHTVTFEWKPTPGKHTVTFEVYSDAAEADLVNNQLTHLRTVEDDPDEGPGFGLPLALIALAGLLVVARLRRED